MKTIRKAVCMMLILAAVQGALFPAEQAKADRRRNETAACFPEADGITETSERLTIDYSHIDRGYVMVKARKTEQRMKLRVEHGDDSLHYEINGDGRYETIPLQFGSGKYRFTLFVSLSRNGNRYTRAGQMTLKCSMEDEDSCFLYPNQYVRYDADSPLVVKAGALCEGMEEPEEIAETICQYVDQHYDYDWVKYFTVKAEDTRNLLPDIETTWQNGIGVCQDLSALLCAMLRSQGIPARLVIGTADGECHAWVLIIIDGEARSYDPTSKSHRSYHAERYY